MKATVRAALLYARSVTDANLSKLKGEQDEATRAVARLGNEIAEANTVIRDIDEALAAPVPVTPPDAVRVDVEAEYEVAPVEVAPSKTRGYRL